MVYMLMALWFILVEFIWFIVLMIQLCLWFIPSAGFLPVILAWNLNDSEFVILSLCYHLEYLWGTAINFWLFLHKYYFTLLDYTLVSQYLYALSCLLGYYFFGCCVLWMVHNFLLLLNSFVCCLCCCIYSFQC